MSESPRTIEALQVEDRVFPPPPEFARGAVAGAELYERAAADLEGFWAEEASRLEWIQPWNTVCDRSNAPFFKWFTGGKLNASVNCLDRHLTTNGDRVAYHWEGEPGDTETITYRDLYERVCRLANGLRALGVGKGGRVAIYLGMVPELPVAMLACARIGAGHTVVFGGFSADSLRDRINDFEATVVITQDEGWRGGQGGPAQGQHRRGPGGLPRRAALRGRAAHRRAHRLGPRARQLVPRRRRRPAGRVRARAHGRRGPAVRAVHVGHHGQAQGDRAHHRRLPDRRRDDPPLRVRPEARDGRVLVRGRHRLGHRAQLHRLRAAGQRRHRRDLRGRARHPGQGPPVGHRRALRGDDPLHGAHRHPHVHEVGRRVRASATTCPRCGCWAASASRSTPRPGSGTTPTSAGAAARSWTPGGRPRPA